MENEKYLNHYVEILTSTMTDVIVRNISMQANARVTEDVVNEQAKRIEELSINVANTNAENDSEIKKLNTTINQLNGELDDLRRQRGEFEAVKSQAQHVDTFRNELVKEREEHKKTRDNYDNIIKELNDKIEYLQLTPAKRKKIDEANKPKETVEMVIQSSEDIVKDGGSF